MSPRAPWTWPFLQKDRRQSPSAPPGWRPPERVISPPRRSAWAKVSPPSASRGRSGRRATTTRRGGPSAATPPASTPSTAAPSARSPSPGRPGPVPSWMSQPSPTSRRREWSATPTRRRPWRPKGSETARASSEMPPGTPSSPQLSCCCPLPPPPRLLLCPTSPRRDPRSPLSSAPRPSLHPTAGLPSHPGAAPGVRWGLRDGRGAGVRRGAGAVEVAGPLHAPPGWGLPAEPPPAARAPPVLPHVLPQ